MSAVQNTEASIAPKKVRSIKAQSLDRRMLGILAAFAVAWGLVCLIGFTLTQVLIADPHVSTYTAEQINYLQNSPFWVSIAKAMTAIGTLVGAVYLFLRKKSAYHWFSVALVGTLLVLLDSVLRDGFHILGGMDTGVNLGMVIVSIFLFWTSYSAFYAGQLED